MLGGTGVSQVGIWQAGVDMDALIGTFSIEAVADISFDGGSFSQGAFSIEAIADVLFEGELFFEGVFALEATATINFAFVPVVIGGESYVCLDGWFSTGFPDDRVPATPEDIVGPASVTLVSGVSQATVQSEVEREC